MVNYASVEDGTASGTASAAETAPSRSRKTIVALALASITLVAGVASTRTVGPKNGSFGNYPPCTTPPDETVALPAVGYGCKCVDWYTDPEYSIIYWCTRCQSLFESVSVPLALAPQVPSARRSTSGLGMRKAGRKAPAKSAQTDKSMGFSLPNANANEDTPHFSTSRLSSDRVFPYPPLSLD